MMTIILSYHRHHNPLKPLTLACTPTTTICPATVVPAVSSGSSSVQVLLHGGQSTARCTITTGHGVTVVVPPFRTPLPMLYLRPWYPQMGPTPTPRTRRSRTETSRGRSTISHLLMGTGTGAGVRGSKRRSTKRNKITWPNSGGKLQKL